MKRILAVMAAIMLLIGCLGSAFAAMNLPEPGEDIYYLDKANVLSEAVEGEIYFSSKLLDEACGAQIVVVAMDTIGSVDIETFSNALFNKWGIGSAKENNGVLLVMTIKEDDYYVSTGMGLQRVLSSSVLKELFDKYLEPDFAAKNYEAGARKFYEAVFAKVAKYYNVEVTTQQGIEAYNAWKNEGSKATVGVYGGAGLGGGSYEDRSSNTSSKYYEEGEIESNFAALIGFIIVLLFILGISSKLRGCGFWFWGPTFYWPFFGPRRYPPNWHDRRPPRGPNGPMGPGSHGYGGGHSSYNSSRSFGSGRSYGSGSSSFGSGRSSSGFSSGRSSGFGGGSFGGGRSSGSGAGRGRH